MRIKANHILFWINALTLTLILIIVFLPNNILRIILGLPFVLFAPGYTLIAALFHRKSDLDSIQRLALSIGLSIAVVPLIGLILNYTWGITTNSILVSITVFVVTMSAIAWFRLRMLPDSEHVTITIPRFSWKERSRLDKTLSIILAVAVFGALGTAIYTIATPKLGEKFTEFYIMDSAGNSTDYPKELQPGDTGTVLLGIINREYEEVTYRVDVKVDGALDNTIGPIVLNHDDKSESIASFTMHRVTTRQKVEFLLYKDGQSDAYLELHLWVNVTNP